MNFKLEPEISRYIQEHLEQSERIVWADRPAARIAFRKSLIPSFSIGFIFVAIAVFAADAILESPRLQQALGAKIFAFAICAGFGAVAFFAFKTPWSAKRFYENSVYVITDRRAIAFFFYQIPPYVIYSFEKIRECLAEEKLSNGSGNLYLNVSYVPAGRDGFLFLSNLESCRRHLDLSMEEYQKNSVRNKVV